MMLTSRYQMWMAWGPELTFFCNDAYSPTLGVKHPWALGKPAKEVWSEIWPDIGPLIEEVLATGEATYSEGMLLLLERSGFPEETYHTFSYSPLFDDDGSIAGMFCVVVEETERVINERRLGTLRELASAIATVQTERELFAIIGRELAKNTADLPFTLTYVLSVDGSTAHLAALSGMKAGHPAAPDTFSLGDSPWGPSPFFPLDDQVILEDLSDRFAGLPKGVWDVSPTNALLTPLRGSGTDQEAAGVLIVGLNPRRTIDGSYRSYIALLVGQIAAALASVRAREDDRRRAEALAQVDRAKTAFFSNVSHEFRTPLTLMLGPLEELLSSSDTSPEARSQVELAHRNGVRLLRLVNSLLDFSRIEAGRVRARFVPVDIGAYSAEIASSFRSATERAGIGLVIESQLVSQPVYLDPELWEKVVLNLVSNAFKFTLEGEIGIKIGPSGDGRHVEVRVSDTGIGIPAEELPRIFDRFHRVEGAKGRTVEGSGIGLSLVRELVNLHGGTLSAESTPGQGTSFLVTLPTGSAHLPPEAVAATGVSLASVHSSGFVEEALRWLPDAAGFLTDTDQPAAGAVEGADGRVVLADDNTDMRDYVARLLTGRGYEVEAVGDGEEALLAARRQTPDLILTDVMMPKLDGFGLLQAVRNERSLAGVPVVMLSARAGEEAKVEGLDAGADDYLVKPFSSRELLARVAANIQMARLRTKAARELFQSERRLQMTNERLDLALATGRIAIFEFDLDADVAKVVGPLTEFFGVSETEAARGLPLRRFLDGIDPADRDRVAALIGDAMMKGQPYEAEYRIVGGAIPRWVVARGTSEQGGRRLVGAVIDISEEKDAEDALREERRALEVLNRTGAAIAAELDLDRVVQSVTDAGVELTGAEFGAFFYNVLNDAGESYMLYALSGVPREAFSKFPMPRNTAIFAPTFTGQGVVRSDDITQDSRYGRNQPNRGMPDGHLPVRSYLAVPVKSRSGEVLGGLFFGHSRTAMFGPKSESIMAGLSAQAAVAIDNANLFQTVQRELAQRKAAEEELHALNAALEGRVVAEVAERLKAEDALRQAQKMEAVGQLTGGVAHDFNNLLTLIIGGLESIRRSGPKEDARLSRSLDMAMQGAQRAASLTSRLLAFSRRQPLEPKPLDLNVIVRDSADLLHRTLGERIELECVTIPRLWMVEADQNQLESALLNLAVNARDAMPDGGKLTIETSNTMLDETYTAVDAEVVPGQYVLISVSDNGSGMDRETLNRVFEPFYTTKEVGKGTGLGLSMVYGFVKQSGGHVTLYSEVGQGTTVKLYFPRYHGLEETTVAEVRRGVPKATGAEVVLVVEDNDDVRAQSLMMLAELGYAVLEAPDAEKAMAIINTSGRIDILFTDVVLPGRTGRQLAEDAVAARPGLRVLFTTGYSRNAIVHHGRLDAGIHLLTKPFTFEQLAGRIRDVLDR
jgi:signal transduction histidine kinase/DNA-binding response OmpR family regulator